jgi:hypothetical protein
MVVKGDTHSAEAPATQRIRTTDGAVHLCPAWWWPEVKTQTAVDRSVGYTLCCPPSVVAQASRSAMLWLAALNVVRPR